MRTTYFRRIMFGILAIVFFLGKTWAIDTLRVVSVEGSPNSEVTVPVELINQDSVAGLQTVVKFSRVTLDSVGLTGRASNMDLSTNIGGDSVGIVIVSLRGEVITPGAGSILSLYFSTSQDLQPGDSVSISFANTILSDPHANRLNVEDMGGWIIVPPRDTLRLMSVNGIPGDTVLVPFELINDVSIGGLQSTIYFDSRALSFLNVFLDSSLSGFSVSENVFSDSLKMIVYSLSGDSICRGTRILGYLEFAIDTTVLPGDSTFVGIRNVVLSDLNPTHVPVVGNGAWIFVTGSKGDLNDDGSVDIADVVREINIILGRVSGSYYERWAADVNNDGRVDVVDVVNTVNLILGRGKGQRNNSGIVHVYIADDGLYMYNEVEIGGIQLELLGEISGIEITNRSSRMSIFKYKQAHITKIVLAGLNGEVIPPGKGYILKFKKCSPIAEKILVVDKYGNKLNIDVSDNLVDLNDVSITPNPMVNNGTISFYLPKRSKIKIKIYNSAGQMVKVIMDRVLNSGYQSINFDLRGIKPGVYFLTLWINKGNVVKKVVVK